MHVVDIFNLTPDQVIKNSRPATTYMLCSRRCSCHRAVSVHLLPYAAGHRQVSPCMTPCYMPCSPNIRPAEDAQWSQLCRC